MHPSNPALEMWPRVVEADEEALVRLAAPYVRWLNPTLLAELARDNDAHLLAWQTVLQHNGVLADLYVWPGSTCAFPGVRRKPGKLDEPDHYLRYDHNGNRLAHRVWELLGTSTTAFKAERASYELVHLLPHQPTEWQKFFVDYPEVAPLLPLAWHQRLVRVGLPALFTNPANMCFLPSILVRPTDRDSLFRRVLWKKAVDQFTSTNLLPPGMAEPFTHWLNTFTEPAGLNWSQRYHGDKAHLQKLLKDRRAHLARYQRVATLPNPDH